MGKSIDIVTAQGEGSWAALLVNLLYSVVKVRFWLALRWYTGLMQIS